ncbi:MAG: hypothetical protein F6K65_20950 [Moorea sp. SIO3C2]|nr:hypothetical protein [Moorena sp. SIO3C2]
MWSVGCGVWGVGCANKRDRNRQVASATKCDRNQINPMMHCPPYICSLFPVPCSLFPTPYSLISYASSKD